MSDQNLITKARQLCESKGARFTSQREKVFAILLQRQYAVGAYDLLDELKQTEESAKPATIYRALEFLLDMGLIHKLESDNKFIACHHFGCHHPVQFLICDECGNVQEIQSTGLHDKLDKQAQSVGFVVTRQTIEAHGRCAKCQKQA